jgi:hypothetical protein
MGLIARLARRRITSQLDNPRRNSPGQRRLADWPGGAGCPPAYVSPEWLRSMRPLVESGELGRGALIFRGPACPGRAPVPGKIAIRATP